MRERLYIKTVHVACAMNGLIDYSASLIVNHRHDAFERLEAQITELWGASECRDLIGAVAAREKVRVARALENLAQMSAAFASGEISYF
jgi:hypothetical protein